MLNETKTNLEKTKLMHLMFKQTKLMKQTKTERNIQPMLKRTTFLMCRKTEVDSTTVNIGKTFGFSCAL